MRGQPGHPHRATVKTGGNRPGWDGLLVIGYGNELRSDDGVGPRVAAAIDELNLPSVKGIACHQLMPELAETVSRAGRVVFVDAAVDEPKEVRFRELAPAESSQLMTHAADPQTLLAMARDVYGHCPEAWWLTIPAEKLEFGEDLSPLTRRGFDEALLKIRVLAAG
jgi:hydrogenase maturation protease